jgi:hypothetical protein
MQFMSQKPLNKLININVKIINNFQFTGISIIIVFKLCLFHLFD